MTLEMTPQLLDRVVERFAALADPTRIRLLQRLRQGEANVGVLAEALGVNQPSVSKHLAVLRRVGILEMRHEGAATIYRIRDASIFDLCHLVCDGVSRFLQAEHAAVASNPVEPS